MEYKKYISKSYCLNYIRNWNRNYKHKYWLYKDSLSDYKLAIEYRNKEGKNFKGLYVWNSPEPIATFEYIKLRFIQKQEELNFIILDILFFRKQIKVKPKRKYKRRRIKNDYWI